MGHFAGYNIPAYFSEFGCITSPPRLWTEVQALFSTQMSPIWSGGTHFVLLRFDNTDILLNPQVLHFHTSLRSLRKVNSVWSRSTGTRLPQAMTSIALLLSMVMRLALIHHRKATQAPLSSLHAHNRTLRSSLQRLFLPPRMTLLVHVLSIT